MCVIFSLVPATVFVVAGYFVLSFARKQDGGIRTFGTVLAVWIFVIAAFFPICGIYMSATGGCPMMSGAHHSSRFPKLQPETHEVRPSLPPRISDEPSGD